MRKRDYRFFVTAVLCALILLTYGCGKKGDPSVIGLSSPGAVSDLSASREGDFVKLDWSVAEKTGDIGRISILRNRMQIGSGECPGCPRAYESLADARPKDLKSVGSDGSFSYRDDSVERGFQYLYIIVVHSSTGQRGEDSNIAEVVFE